MLILCPAALRHYKCRVDETLFFIQCASVAKLIGDIRQDLTQDFAMAPSFVVTLIQRCGGMGRRPMRLLD